MKIQLCKRNGGWLLLIFLAIVVIVVAGIVIVGLCQIAKKIDKPEDRHEAAQEAWGEALAFADSFAEQNNTSPTNINNIRLLEQSAQGWAYVRSSSNGLNWQDGTNAPMSIEAAQSWQMPAPNPNVPMMFYQVIIVVTNQP